MKAWSLIDSIVDRNHEIVLRFYDNSAEEMIKVRDTTYKPYFLLSFPLTKKDEYSIERILGKVSIVERRDLFSNNLRTMAKVETRNPVEAQKLGKMFESIWESELEFSHGYAYDNGLVFGSQYIINEKNLFSPLQSIEAREKFQKIFGSVEKTDPSKYVHLKEFFDLCYQPIPQIDPETLGMPKKTDPEQYYLTFMLSRIANLPVPKAFSNKRVSEWIKSVLYTHLRRNAYLIPTSKELRRGEELKGSVPGALTITPKSGVYFNTVVTDFESLYPSCIDRYNLSYETVDCGHRECKSKRTPELDHYSCTKNRGFYSAIIGALKDLRIHYFKPLSKSTSASKHERLLAKALARLLKLLLVSSYGVTIRIHGLASTPLAESITGCGRYALQTTWNMAEEHGMHPTYGDTDSIFLDNPSEEDVKWLVEEVKTKLQLDLAVDKRYSLCVLSGAKKAYFGISRDGTPDIKGLTVIKSNSPRFFLKVFQSCVKELAHVRNLEEYEQAKAGITRIVNRAVRDLRERRVKLEDLAYSVKLYSDPKEKIRSEEALHQPYQCAVQLIDAGESLGKRETVSFVKVNPFNYKGRRFTVKPKGHMKSLLDINVEDYVRNLRTALGQTFDPMNIEFSAKRDKMISDWFETR
ncbi:MAG: hypothetical protein JSV58_07245 [Candidatus Bathyarchaeota archaeon]|nr:MAG: hypothetical protein JSV58_07245 [Candidatus Bathyarchaeota archaeon]